LERIKSFIASREVDFRQRSGLDFYEKRRALIAEIYSKTGVDINTAFEEFLYMYNQIKGEEASLYEKLDINITLDESAVDELINQATELDQDAATLTFQLAKKLEYGLKLVKDRSGMQNFVIDGEAVTDMDKYINGLVTRIYRED
jgi:ATP-dependent Clp protease ATP-binding subunit ClpX